MLRPVSPPLSDLRPLALGELIDRSATFWRKHLPALFGLTLGFDLVLYIITKGLQLTTQHNYLALQGAIRTGDTPSMLAEYAQLLSVSAVTMVVYIWIYFLNSLVVARYVVPTQLGESVRPAECLRRAVKRLGALTGAYVLSLLWGLGANLLLMLPGGALAAGGGLLLVSEGTGARVAGAVVLAVGALLMVLGLLGGILWYLLRFSLLSPVLAMEDLSAVRAFRRSGELLSGRVEPGFTGRVRVRAMILVTVVSVIILAVSLLSGLPAIILQFAYSTSADPMSLATGGAPQVLLVPAELLQAVGQGVFSPLGLVFYAMFYLDMRVRREGLDLERRLEARSAPAVAA